jgi:hypothetical protein
MNKAKQEEKGVFRQANKRTELKTRKIKKRGG